ncbi:MAG: zinc-dependent alcohol dehydrogenase [Spirochaetota bacterium]
MKASNEVARTVVFEAPGAVALRREPVEPTDDQVIVRSELIGISHGTERLFFRGPFPTGQLLERRHTIGAAAGYPIAYGYMNVGTLEDGTRVFAFEPHRDVFAADGSSLLTVPDGIAPDDAVLYPSVETAVQIVHDTAPALGERVLVCGLGVIGLLVTTLLARFPIEVVAVDPVATRRRRAEALGVATVDASDPVAADELVARSETVGFDTAINVSSSGEALQLAIDALKPEGTVVEASWYGEKTTELSLGSAFHRRRLTIRSSQVSSLNAAMQPRWNRERRTALTWKLVRDLRPGSLITHRFALDDAPRAYDFIDQEPDGLLQAVLVP